MTAIRITPAYAGKSLKRRMRQFGCQDHPRLCGEKRATSGRSSRSTGSPPPMRGKGEDRRNSATDNGITPAYAGKSRCGCRWRKKLRDHPRLCGEKFRIHSFITCQPGSPPPMRGKDYTPHCVKCQEGITPAYAGKRQLSTP